MATLERLYKALANRRRLAILAFLRDSPSATVGEIADSIRLSFRSTSRHLGKLKGAGILECEQVGLEVRYRLAPAQTPAVRLLLTEL